MVVALHVGGLSLVLLQGCGKDSTKTTASAETNTTALSYDTNQPASMFANATNTGAGANLAHANTNVPMQGAAFGTPQPGGLAGIQEPAMPAPLPSDQIAPAGPQKDYKIQRGDLLSTIATKNGVTIGAIMKANPNLDPKKLKIGQTIKIPAPAAASAGTRLAAGTGSTPPTGATGVDAGAASGTYKVKAGDTLTKIAKAHGITVNQLRAANNMKTTQVQVGKVLRIPARTQRTAAATNTTTAQ
jgi:LysM repeat protein